MGSGVTNFLSTIEARSLGTADIDKMSAAIDKQTAALEGLGKKATTVNEHPGFNSFAEKVKQGIENPLGAIGGAAESALAALGPVGTGVVAIAAGFGAFAKFSMDAARELGHLGDQIEDTGIRMGLTNKEVQQFSFAMKYAGGDMGSLEGIMRKLSQEIDTGGKHLKAMGIDFRDTQTGAILPMSGVILQLSERLKAIPDAATRNAEAIKVMGKSALTVLPDLLELPDAMEAARKAGLVFSDQELASFKEMHQAASRFDQFWDHWVTKLKAGVTIPFVFLMKDTSGKQYTFDDLAKRGVNLGAFAPRTAEQQDQDKRNAGFGALVDRDLGFANNIGMERLEAKDRALFARQRGDAAVAGFESSQGLPFRLKAAEKELSELTAPETGKSSVADVAAYQAAERKVKAIEGQIKATKELETAQKSIFEIEKKSQEAYAKGFFGEQNPATQYSFARAKIEAQRLDDLRKTGQSPELRARINSAADLETIGAWDTFNRKMDEERSKFFKGFDDFVDGFFDPDKIEASSKKMLDRIEQGLTGTGFLDAQGRLQPGFGASTVRPQGTSAEQALRNAHDNERRGLGLYGGQAALGGVSEIDQINTIASLRKGYADQEFDALKRMADVKNDEQAKQDAIDQQHQKYMDAEIERQQALLQLAVRQKQEFQSLAVGLFEAATSGNVGGFLKSTGMGIADKVVGNAAGMAWNSVKDSIPRSGSKLLEGTMFGADPLKSATDLNTLATVANTTALKAIALSPSGGGGSAGGGFSSAAGTFARLAGIDGAPDIYNLPTNPSPASDRVSNAMNWGLTDPVGSPIGSASKFGPRQAAGVGAAALAGGFGLYSGIEQGGARGALTAGGSAVAMVGAILPLLSKSLAIAGPIGMIAGMGLGLLTTFLGDPKKNRANDLQNEANSRAYAMPTGADYSSDIYGRSLSYDSRGGLRPIVIYQTNQIQAIDGPNLEGHLKANPSAVSVGIVNAITSGNGEDVLATLRLNM